MTRALLTLTAAALLSTPAVAQPADPFPTTNGSAVMTAAGRRPPASLEPSKHVFTAYAQLGGLIYLSRFQTAGGVGGGLGVRDTYAGRYLVQADFHHLVEIGNAFAIRLGAGLQRAATDEAGNERVWIPAVLLTGTVHMGDRLRFLTFEHPTPVVAPATALGVAVAPLRFQLQQAEVSLLEIGAGVGWDFPG
ncbi:MAG: hypothetical protein IRZ16_23415, partial [Myxococcaceae bacterium]|nr:hypothetical protein [Myxococcaceae bacterium]